MGLFRLCVCVCVCVHRHTCVIFDGSLKVLLKMSLHPTCNLSNVSHLGGAAVNVQWNFEAPVMELDWQRGANTSHGEECLISYVLHVGMGWIDPFKKAKCGESWGASITSVDSHRENWFCQLFRQINYSTEQLPQSWRQSLLHTSCLLDK